MYSDKLCMFISLVIEGGEWQEFRLLIMKRFFHTVCHTKLIWGRAYIIPSEIHRTLRVGYLCPFGVPSPLFRASLYCGVLRISSVRMTGDS